MEKRNLRKIVRARVASLSAVEKEQKSTMLALAILLHPAVREARVVALFSPLPDEPQIGEIVATIAAGRTVVLPRVEGDVMRFYPFSPATLAEGAYGIMEPQGGEPFPCSEIDVMVVPGVAFTTAGARMGRGKGFYDKYMSQPGFVARKIGVCYAEQLSDTLPVEPYDIMVDEVIYR